MTATEELRRLLDERRVEYKDRNVFGKHVFHWGKPFHGAMFTDGGEWTELVVENATPEQAVEATLGRGTCEAEVEVVEFSQMQELHRFTCSECGEFFGAEEHSGLFGIVLDKVKLPNFCPNCGRKVRA